MIERIGFGDIPVVTAWTSDYRDAYEPSGSNRYAEYVERLRKLDPQIATEDQLIHLAINLSVEGEARKALVVLGHIDHGPWPATRRAALFRLTGALHRETGATRAAIASYSQALTELGHEHVAATSIEWDLFELEGAVDRHAVHERRKDLVARPLPVTPAYLFARSYAADALSKELFQERRRSAGTSFRFRSGLPDELAWHNTALAIAYITGDYGDATAARRHFGRVAAEISQEGTGLDLVVAAKELLAAHDSGAILSLLRESGHIIHAELNVDALAAALRPAEDDGEAAEVLWETLLAVLRTTAPYFKPDTLAMLTKTFTDYAIEYLGGKRMQPVAYSGGHGWRSTDAFTEAFAEVARFTPGDLFRFVDAIGQYSHPFGIVGNTFWDVVAQHGWRPEDTAAAEQVVAIATARELRPHEERSILVVLHAIRTSFPLLAEKVDAWVLQQPLGSYELLRFFAHARHELAAEHIIPWISDVVAKTVAGLAGMEPRSPISFPFQEPARIIAQAVRSYDISRQLATEWATRMLRASTNNNIYVEAKAALFGGLARLCAIGDTDAIAREIANRPPSYERSRTESMMEAPPESLAQLRLLEIRKTVGIDVSDDDKNLLNESFVDSDYRVRAAAATVGTAVLDLSDACWAREVTAHLLHLLSDDSYVVRAAGVRVLCDSGLVFLSQLRTAGLRRLSFVLANDNPYVMQVMLYGLVEGFRRTPPSCVRQVAALGELAAASLHSGVRRAGNALLGAVGDSGSPGGS